MADTTNKKYFPELAHSARAAYKKLSDYYMRTDNSPIYSVAIALHPTCRYDYWKKEEWGEFEESAKKAVRQVWVEGYKPRAHGVSSVGPPLSEPSSLNRSLIRLVRSKTHISNHNDELEIFASSDTVLQAPLEWWKNNHTLYPELSKMARDYFGIMATSAPSERAFSRARGLLRYQRNRLGPDKIQQNMCLRTWFEYFDRNNKE